MLTYFICKTTHLPTGRYFLGQHADAEKARNVWRTKLKNHDRLLPSTVRSLLAGEPARPEDWSFEVLEQVSYQDYGQARDGFDAVLLRHIEQVGWDRLLNVDAYERTADGRRVLTSESARRRREANGTAAWDKF